MCRQMVRTDRPRRQPKEAGSGPLRPFPGFTPEQSSPQRRGRKAQGPLRGRLRRHRDDAAGSGAIFSSMLEPIALTTLLRIPRTLGAPQSDCGLTECATAGNGELRGLPPTPVVVLTFGLLDPKAAGFRVAAIRPVMKLLAPLDGGRRLMTRDVRGAAGCPHFEQANRLRGRRNQNWGSGAQASRSDQSNSNTYRIVGCAQSHSLRTVGSLV
jgi:hypothetical protein